MKLRQLFEEIARTGKGKSAVVGWGRGMGHKGHMMLASSVITQANETGADPYFVVSKTIGKDDPITPEEKLHLYKKVFPKHGHIFHVATDEMPDLNRVLTQLGHHGYTDATVIVGADQKAAFQYLVRPDKSGVEPFKQFGLNSLHVISRQETNDPSREEEGPRATPMRNILKDPNATEDEKFATWRDAMNPEVSDDEVRDLMAKAQQRMNDPAFGKKPKTPKKQPVAADEGIMGFLGQTAPAVKKQTSTLSSIRTAVAADKAASDALPPPHIRMYLHRIKDAKDKGIQPQFTASEYETLQNYIKNQQMYKENSIKYANKLLREMKASEFIKEAKTTALNKDHDAVGKGVSRSRDVGGYDRIYHMNRMMMAMAMADGVSTGKIDGVNIDTWFEKYNTMHPMTKEEDNMIRAAMNTVPTDGKHVSKFGKSVEPAGAYTKSAVPKIKKNKYGI